MTARSWGALLEWRVPSGSEFRSLDLRTGSVCRAIRAVGVELTRPFSHYLGRSTARSASTHLWLEIKIIKIEIEKALSVQVSARRSGFTVGLFHTGVHM